MLQKVIILIIASQGFQATEYNAPKKVLQKAGYQVLTGSDKKGTAIAHDKSTAQVDLLVHDVDPASVAGIFFVGGGGALDRLDNQTSYDLIKKAYAQGILVGAICISPRILGAAGILKNKKAAGWDGDGKLDDVFKSYGVTRIHKDVVVDGNIVTAVGPHAAHEFGETIVSLLKTH